MNIAHRYQPALSWINEFDRFFDRTRPDPGVREASYESDDAWIVRIDVPGFAREDVKLTLTDQTLHLAAEAPAERAFGGKIERRWKLGGGIDPAGLTAKLENGVLELTLPKRPKAEPRTLDIEIH